MTAAGRTGATPLNLHAVAVVVGEQGILVRGASGVGKTRLGLALVAEGRGRGRFARIVADDRTLVAARTGRLVARPHPAVAGLAERRGLGILAVSHEPACVVRLVVDLAGPRMGLSGPPVGLSDPPVRLPDGAALVTTIDGTAVPRLAVAAETATPDSVALVFDALAFLARPSPIATFSSLTTSS